MALDDVFEALCHFWKRCIPGHIRKRIVPITPPLWGNEPPRKVENRAEQSPFGAQQAKIHRRGWITLQFCDAVSLGSHVENAAHTAIGAYRFPNTHPVG